MNGDDPKPRGDRLSPFAGLSALPEAFALLVRRPRLWLYAAPPMALSALFVFFAFGRLKGLLDAAIFKWFAGATIGSWLAHHASIGSFVYSLLGFVSWTFTLIATTLAFAWVYLLISLPFADPLAEEAERALGIHPDGPVGRAAVPVPSFWARAGIDLLKSFATVGLQLVVFAGTVAFFWVPGIHFVAFVANAYLLAFQFLSYPQTRRGWGVRRSFAMIRERPFVSFGFGASVACIYFIPYFSAFLTPIAVVAGTILFAKINAAARDVPRG